MKLKIKNAKLKIVEKPWGKEIWFAYNKKYVGKIIWIKKGHRLSKQYHRFKHETLYTNQGKYILEINGKRKLMKEGSVVVIPPKCIHRLEAKYGNVKIIEVSTPQVKDVVRLEDDYGR